MATWLSNGNTATIGPVLGEPDNGKQMANVTENSGRPFRRFAFKHWALLALALITLLVLYNNERFIVIHAHPDWEYFFPVR